MRWALLLVLGCGDRTFLNDAFPDGSLPPLTDATVDAIADDSPTLVPKCDPILCPHGCCQANGTCVTTSNNHACGTGGEACEDCGSGTCAKQTCVRPQPNCGPSNCTGCCLSSVECATGIHHTFCGHGGEACMGCTACVPVNGGGVCNDPPPGCNSATCPIGCCDGNVCKPGWHDDACGSQAGACVNCTARGGWCNAWMCTK